MTNTHPDVYAQMVDAIRNGSRLSVRPDDQQGGWYISESHGRIGPQYSWGNWPARALARVVLSEARARARYLDTLATARSTHAP